jgi:hypothetical protein
MVFFDCKCLQTSKIAKQSLLLPYVGYYRPAGKKMANNAHFFFVFWHVKVLNDLRELTT